MWFGYKFICWFWERVLNKLCKRAGKLTYQALKAEVRGDTELADKLIEELESLDVEFQEYTKYLSYLRSLPLLRKEET
jgi:phage shock protein A